MEPDPPLKAVLLCVPGGTGPLPHALAMWYAIREEDLDQLAAGPVPPVLAGYRHVARTDLPPEAGDPACIEARAAVELGAVLPGRAIWIAWTHPEGTWIEPQRQ